VRPQPLPAVLVLASALALFPARPARADGPDPDPDQDQDLARAIAHTFMREHPPERLRWSWEEAVAVEGLLACGRRANDPAPLAYARAWVDAHEREALTVALWADAAAPAATALALLRTPLARPRDVRIAARVDAYVRRGAKRTRGGALSHTGDLLGGTLPAQAWVDSLFMHGVYLNRRGRREPWARVEARRLGLAVTRALGDPETGLFRHAAIDLPGGGLLRLPAERCFWARGNGWAAFFLTDVAPAPELAVARDRLLAAVVAAQDPATGLWRTDLLGGASDDNPLETSASALFIAALARAGRSPEAVARGLAGIRARVRRERAGAVVTGTSLGTTPGTRAQYRLVPLGDDAPHGVGAVLLALAAGR